MPISRNEKILIVGAVGGGLALIGLAALAQKQAAAKTAPFVPLLATTALDLIPPYINQGTIIVKQDGNSSGPPVQFANLPDQTVPAVEFQALNLLGTGTQGYAYLKYDLTRFQPAQIILTEIGAYVNNDTGWETITGKLNIWDENGVNDANWFIGGGTGFIAGMDLVAAGSTSKLETKALNIDVSSKKALTVEPAFSGGPFPDVAAHAYLAPFYLNVQVTEYVSITVNVLTDGGVLLTPTTSQIQILNSLGQAVASGSTNTGTLTFNNLLADTFTINVIVGTTNQRHLSQSVTVVSGAVTVSFSVLHPVAIFTVSPSPASSGQTVTLNPAGTTDPQGSIISQQWSVLSGSTVIVSQTFLPGQPGFLQPYSYVTPAGTATETILLNVTNDAGLGSTATYTELIENFGQLNVTIADNQSNTYPNIEVDVYDSTNSLVAKAFTNNLGVATFNLPVANGYTVKASLALNGAPGITKSVTQNIFTGIQSTTIGWNHPTCSFTLSPPGFTDVAQGLIAQATVNSGETDPTIFYGKYSWGDGSSNDTNNTGNLLSLATHTYSAATASEIQLLVRNNAGLGTQVLHSILVNPALTAVITVVTPNPTNGTPVVFSATASGGTPYGQGYVFQQWSFGDGTSSIFGAGPNVDHTYAKPGTYTVSLQVADQVGAITVQKAVTIVSAIVPIDSRVYPESIALTNPVGNTATLTVTGILAMLGDMFAEGAVTLSSVTTENAAYGSVPGGSGLYDIGEDMDNAGTVDVVSFTAVSAHYGFSVDPQYLNGQIVAIEAYSPSNAAWFLLGSATTGPNVVPFRSKSYAQTINALGYFSFTGTNAPADTSQVRFVFGGNLALKASVSPGYTIGQALR